MKIKLYIPEYSYLDNKNLIGLLLPILNKEKKIKEFHNYYHLANNLFEICKIPNASDFFILPGLIRNYNKNNEIYKLKKIKNDAAKNSTPLLMFNNGDKTLLNSDKNIILFQNSMHKKVNNNCLNTYASPAFVKNNFDYIHTDTYIRPYNKCPSIGFCGSTITKLNLLNKLKIKYKHYFVDSYMDKAQLRNRIIQKLEKSKGLTTNFIIRDKYLGDTKNLNIEKEFYDNIINSDYTLCIRGAGNFSKRFYETTQAGRLPFLIDTECILPFENEIDYNSFCIRIPHNEINIVKRFLQEHNKLDDTAFRNKQSIARFVWKKYFSPEGFYSNVHNLLLKLK